MGSLTTEIARLKCSFHDLSEILASTLAFQGGLASAKRAREGIDSGGICQMELCGGSQQKSRSIREDLISLLAQVVYYFVLLLASNLIALTA